MSKPSFVYVTYIKTTAEKVWTALTDGEATRQYWFNHRNASDWKVGSEWRHEDYDDPKTVDVVGTVVESDRPRRLVVTWADPTEAKNPAKMSRLTYDIVEDGDLVRLTVTHADLEPGSDMEKGVSSGWPVVLSSLKTMLETGKPLPAMFAREYGEWKKRRFATVG
jgi:uncharacterized protein YndB with AHSA1/START domain